MKNKIPNKLILIFAIGFMCNYAKAQEEIKGLKQKIEIAIDELGNADVTIEMKLNALQWDNFKRTAGNNPAYLKREMVKSMPTAYLTDFRYNENTMDRSYRFSMKALGIAKLDKNGKWKGELDSKDPDISRVNDREYRLNMNYMTDGALIEQVQIIKLPANAKNSKIEKDSFGKAVLTYETGSGFMKTGLNVFGALLIVSGVVAGGLRLRGIT